MWTDSDVDEREPRRSEGWTGSSFTDILPDEWTNRQTYIPLLCMLSLPCIVLQYLIVSLGQGLAPLP